MTNRTAIKKPDCFGRPKYVKGNNDCEFLGMPCKSCFIVDKCIDQKTRSDKFLKTLSEL